MRAWTTLTAFSLVLFAAHLQGPQPSLGTRMRHSQNSRTRFQQRINRLGQSKMELIRSGKLGKSRELPTGFVLIGGQVVDSTNKVIQKQMQTGTAYYSFSDTQGRQPLFLRPGNEMGWHFVVFQDPFYWRGSGHLILLKKVLGVTIAKSLQQTDTLYEAYTMSLRVSLHPRVHLRDPTFRRKLEKRRRKYTRVVNKRKKARKGPHLRDRAGNLGKRKKRSVFIVDVMDSLSSRGDCILTPLNVTRALHRLILQNETDKNNRSTRATGLKQSPVSHQII